tara:strand:+ start:664 stop:1509 length:846 start_codon:yes stop_codon:yes gene_type:complete
MSVIKPNTLQDFTMLKGKRKICMTTAYDFHSASLAEESDIDAILVGDSAAMVMLGHNNTVQITIEEMILFSKAVARAAKNTIIISDMPFLSYQVSDELAILNAGKLIKETNVNAVKIEGGSEYAGLIKKLVKAGIPVMGHIGLLPQSASLSKGFKRSGQDSKEAEKIIQDAKSIEESGVFSIVLEMVPNEVSKIIMDNTKVPIIGIGSGPNCDGQILVWHDLLGFDEKKRIFLKRYANLRSNITKALNQYKKEVIENEFPKDNNSFYMNKNEYEKLLKKIK